MATTPQPTHASNDEPLLPDLKPPSTTINTTSTPSSTAGTKRPAPSLLPPFEPLSSSPGLPRPLKRRNTGGSGLQQPAFLATISSDAAVQQLHSRHARLQYPTPVPTSSTGILSSSPQHHQQQRPALRRSVSERAPLSAVPSVTLSENGETLMMGRSSNSSHYQLSANRLVSGTCQGTLRRCSGCLRCEQGRDYVQWLERPEAAQSGADVGAIQGRQLYQRDRGYGDHGGCARCASLDSVAQEQQRNRCHIV